MADSDNDNGLTDAITLRGFAWKLVIGLLAFYFLLGFDIEILGVPSSLGPINLLPTANRLRTVSIAASVVLTIMLIYVYTQIGSIQQDQTEQLEAQKDLQEEVKKLQERQTDIFQSQESWMAAEHKPKISVQSLRVQDDDLSITLSNYGNGVATELTLVARIFAGEEGWSLESEEVEYEAQLRNELGTRAKQAGNDIDHFRGTVRLSEQSRTEDDPDSIVTEFVAIEELYCWISVAFEDIGGSKDERGIWAARIEISDADFTLQDIIDNKIELTPAFDNIIEPTIGNLDP